MGRANSRLRLAAYCAVLIAGVAAVEIGGSFLPSASFEAEAGSPAGQPAPAKCRDTKPSKLKPPRQPDIEFKLDKWYASPDRAIWVGAGFGWLVSGNKIIWLRPAGTELTITGRWLDEEAPPVRLAEDSRDSYPTGFTVTRVNFPAAGCWEITAKNEASELRFVKKVISRPDASRAPNCKGRCKD